MVTFRPLASRFTLTLIRVDRTGQFEADHSVLVRRKGMRTPCTLVTCADASRLLSEAGGAGLGTERGSAGLSLGCTQGEAYFTVFLPSIMCRISIMFFYSWQTVTTTPVFHLKTQNNDPLR